jgi:DNA-binding transcriptional ArsR family regulator
MAKALANPSRAQILEWLRNPRDHFPPQKDGDLVSDGVCSLFIAEKLGVTPSTAGEHLKILSDARLLQSKRIKQWVFYRRDEPAIAAAKRVLGGDW